MKKNTKMIRVHILVSFLLVFSLQLLVTTSEAKDSWRNYKDPQSPIYTGNFSDRPTEQRATRNYKIVSYNLHFSKEIVKIGEYFSSLPELKDADVIFLQEVTGIPGDSQKHSAQYLAQKLKYNYVYAPAFIQPSNSLDFGVAVLSKFPIRSFQKIILPHRYFLSGTQRVALYAQLDDGGKLFDVVSTHLETLQFSYQRNDQAQSTIGPILNSTNPVFVAGDFNSAPFWQRWNLIRFMKHNHLTYFSRHYGLTTQTLMKLDLGFGRGVNVTHSGLLKIKTSDHYPVWFTVSL